MESEIASAANAPAAKNPDTITVTMNTGRAFRIHQSPFALEGPSTTMWIHPQQAEGHGLSNTLTPKAGIAKLNPKAVEIFNYHRLSDLFGLIGLFKHRPDSLPILPKMMQIAF